MRWPVVALAVLALGCGPKAPGEDEPDGARSRFDDAGNVLPSLDSGTVLAVDSGIGSNQLAVNQSGSRIKMNVGSTADGAKMFLGWIDTQLNTGCSFYSAADGKTRCLPAGATGSFYFSDAACTMPLITSFAGPNPTPSCPALNIPPVMYTGTSIPCGGGLRVWQRGASYAGQVYFQPSSTCAAVTRPAGYSFFSTTEVPATSFVEMTSQVQ